MVKLNTHWTNLMLADNHFWPWWPRAGLNECFECRLRYLRPAASHQAFRDDVDLILHLHFLLAVSHDLDQQHSEVWAAKVKCQEFTLLCDKDVNPQRHGFTSKLVLYHIWKLITAYLRVTTIPAQMKHLLHWVYLFGLCCFHLTCFYKCGCLWCFLLFLTLRSSLCTCSLKCVCKVKNKSALRNRRRLPVPSGVERTNVGSILTAAVELVSLQRPLSISRRNWIDISIKVRSASRKWCRYLSTCITGESEIITLWMKGLWTIV